MPGLSARRPSLPPSRSSSAARAAARAHARPPDDAYEHDGQITKRRHPRDHAGSAVPVANHAAVGHSARAAGGSNQWRARGSGCTGGGDRTRRATGAASRAQRAAARRPVAGVVTGAAPAALDGLPTPDAIFVGGGPLRGPARTLPRRARSRRPARRQRRHDRGRGRARASAASWGGRPVRGRRSRTPSRRRYTAWRPAMSITQWELR